MAKADLLDIVPYLLIKEKTGMVNLSWNYIAVIELFTTGYYIYLE